eukprot:TRINITY_DN539_c0_g1_i2.p1 TRINITY_DN539_c0_g1~~TRINITY_DN539_c0_g1_i2.p1  ORF type:complete len:195 (+),score=26.32 TRINITY_DN539_c0_g1_i2:78-662(+)
MLRAAAQDEVDHEATEHEAPEAEAEPLAALAAAAPAAAGGADDDVGNSSSSENSELTGARAHPVGNQQRQQHISSPEQSTGATRRTEARNSRRPPSTTQTRASTIRVAVTMPRLQREQRRLRRRSEAEQQRLDVNQKDKGHNFVPNLPDCDLFDLCTVCQERLRNQDNVRMYCGHTFHFLCFVQVVATASTARA